MRNRTAIGIFLTLAFASTAIAESPFVGRWTATAAAPTGPASETVTVLKDGGGYAITARQVEPTPGQPEAGPGKDIVLEGNQFTYKRTLKIGDGELVITYSGVVTGDTFTGTVDIGGMAKMAYTGVRIKSDG